MVAALVPLPVVLFNDSVSTKCNVSWWYKSSHFHECQFILGKHKRHTMWHLHNSHFWHLVFWKKRGKAFVFFGRQIWQIVRLQNALQIESPDPKSLKLDPLGIQNWSQIDAKSVKYPTHGDIKANSDFGLILTLLCLQLLVTFETNLKYNCNKFCTASKHSNQKTH